VPAATVQAYFAQLVYNDAVVEVYPGADERMAAEQGYETGNSFVLAKQCREPLIRTIDVEKAERRAATRLKKLLKDISCPTQRQRKTQDILDQEMAKVEPRALSGEDFKEAHGWKVRCFRAHVAFIRP